MADATPGGLPSPRPTLTPTGLCGSCRHARVVPSARGPHYLRCARSDGDASYARYPRLPVQRCEGFGALDG